MAVMQDGPMRAIAWSCHPGQKEAGRNALAGRLWQPSEARSESGRIDRIPM